jgi:hypothetical protein
MARPRVHVVSIICNDKIAPILIVPKPSHQQSKGFAEELKFGSIFRSGKHQLFALSGNSL